MKRIFILVCLSILLVSCGGGGGGGSETSENANETPNTETPTETPQQGSSVTAEYFVDNNSCLTTSNAEATVNYTNPANSSYMAKTLIWNCADYPSFGYQDKHIEFHFVSYGGGDCYKYNTYYVTDGTCNATATAPSTPVFSATISDLAVTFGAAQQGSTCHPAAYSGTITNTGNVTLIDIILDASYIYGEILSNINVPVNGSYSFNESSTCSHKDPGTYTSTLTLRGWDYVSTLATADVTYNVP